MDEFLNDLTMKPSSFAWDLEGIGIRTGSDFWILSRDGISTIKSYEYKRGDRSEI